MLHLILGSLRSELDPQTTEGHLLIGRFVCSIYSHKDLSRFNDQQQLEIFQLLLHTSTFQQANDISIPKFCHKLYEFTETLSALLIILEKSDENVTCNRQK